MPLLQKLGNTRKTKQNKGLPWLKTVVAASFPHVLVVDLGLLAVKGLPRLPAAVGRLRRHINIEELAPERPQVAVEVAGGLAKLFDRHRLPFVCRRDTAAQGLFAVHMLIGRGELRPVVVMPVGPLVEKIPDVLLVADTENVDGLAQP